MNWFLFRMLERKAVEVLLRSPAFHRGVQNVHKRVHEMQHGKPPEYFGGTNLENNSPQAQHGVKKFVELFWDELKTGHKKTDAPAKGKK